jgi:hypothetical protein
MRDLTFASACTHRLVILSCFVPDLVFTPLCFNCVNLTDYVVQILRTLHVSVCKPLSSACVQENFALALC